MARTAGTLGMILFTVTAAGILAAPALIAVFAPGFIAGDHAVSADRYELSVDMLRWTFPYLLFISLAALAGGILNTYHRYAAAAFSPVLLNVMMIVFAALISPSYHRPGMALAAGVFASGLVQLLFMLPGLFSLRLVPRPRWGWSHPGVRRILALMVPGVFGSSVAQVSILLDTLIASFLVTGSISWLYYSDRVMEFPLGVFGIALATVTLPNLSRQHASGAKDQFSRMLDWSIRVTLLIATPAALGIAVLAGPILATLFFGGRFDVKDVDMAAISLVAYSLGLVGFTLVKVLAPGYFARQDTRAPVRVGLMALGFSMGFDIVVVVPWALAGWQAPHAGLALATSLGSFVNSALLYRGLRRQGVLSHQPGFGKFLVRVGVAAGAMTLLLLEFTPATRAWLEQGFWTRCAWLTAALAGAVVVYFGTLLAVGLRPADLRMKTSAATL